MDELLRTIWLHGASSLASPILVYAILLLMTIGSFVHSRILKDKDFDGLIASVVVAVLLTIVLVILAVLPTSPLLGVTGRLIPSPWIHGLPASCMVCSILVSLTYGLVSGNVHGFSSILENLTYGISKWPWVLLLSMLLTVIISLF